MKLNKYGVLEQHRNCDRGYATELASNVFDVTAGGTLRPKRRQKAWHLSGIVGSSGGLIDLYFEGYAKGYRFSPEENAGREIDLKLDPVDIQIDVMGQLSLDFILTAERVF